METVKWILNLLFGWLKPKPTISWEKVSPHYPTIKPFIKWEVKGKDLFLDGHGGPGFYPSYPMSKSDLEDALLRLKEKIASSGRAITIEAIYIEKHIAIGLWNEGTITFEHLQSADGRYRGTTFQIELLGEQYTMSIQSGTYYMDYEFIVQGIPDVVRVRDLPDTLSLVTGEQAFPIN